MSEREGRGQRQEFARRQNVLERIAAARGHQVATAIDVSYPKKEFRIAKHDRNCAVCSARRR